MIQALWNLEFTRALVLVFIAGVTDAIDGYLARRFEWTSRVGAYLDPAADKLLLVSVYVMLGLDRAIPYWLVWLVLGRDVLILTMVAIAFAFTSIRRFPPSTRGKLSTIMQVLTALIVLGNLVLARRGGNLVTDLVTRLVTVLIYLTLFTTILSGVDYAQRGLRQWSAARLRLSRM